MAKTTAKKQAARPKRDLTLEDAQRAKRRLRALTQAQRDIGRLATQLLRASDESRSKLLGLARAIAGEQGLELRPRQTTDMTREEIAQYDEDLRRSLAANSVDKGVRERA